MNPCVFTGANVVLNEHGAMIHCDVFLVGETFIFTGYKDWIHELPETDKIDAYINVGEGMEYRPAPFIAMPMSRVQWTDRGAAYVRRNIEAEETVIWE